MSNEDNEQYPLVSIFIPTYKQEEYIEKAIQSALNQSYPNIEILIGNDHSPDNTYNKVKPFLNNAKIRYIEHSPNKGRVGNYHSLLYEYAQGEYSINLDGDDYFYDNTYIEEAINLATSHNLALVFAKKATLLQTSQYEKEIFNLSNSEIPPLISGNEIFMKYLQGVFIPHLSVLYHTKTAKSVGFYTKNIISSDSESILKLLINNNVGFINTYAGVWRKHLENESSTLDIDKIMSNITFIESAANYAQTQNAFSQKEIENWEYMMKVRYFIKHLTKSILSQGKIHEENLSQAIYKYNPSIYKNTVKSHKLRFIRLISKNKPLTQIFFKYVIKQESMALEYK